MTPRAGHQYDPSVTATEDTTAKLQGIGHRVTATRRAVLDAMSASPRPFTIEEICGAAPGVGRATVFRTVKLLQSPVTGLPEGLAAEAGLAESGLSEFGVPAQALAAEARLLTQPVSAETASTSHHEGIEDRITLAPLSARRLAEQVALGERLAAIELVVAAQAIDLRGRPRLGAGTGAAYAQVRERVPATGRGEPPPQDVEPVRELIRSGVLGR